MFFYMSRWLFSIWFLIFPCPFFYFHVKKKCMSELLIAELFRVLGKYTIFLGESMPMLSRLIHQFPHIDLQCSPLLVLFLSLNMRARFCGMSMLPLGIGILLVRTCIYFGLRVRGYISSARFFVKLALAVRWFMIFSASNCYLFYHIFFCVIPFQVSILWLSIPGWNHSWVKGSLIEYL